MLFTASQSYSAQRALYSLVMAEVGQGKPTVCLSLSSSMTVPNGRSALLVSKTYKPSGLLMICCDREQSGWWVKRIRQARCGFVMYGTVGHDKSSHFDVAFATVFPEPGQNQLSVALGFANEPGTRSIWGRIIAQQLLSRLVKRRRCKAPVEAREGS